LFQDSDLSTDDASASDTDENEDEDAPITASNFAARSRALDARAARDAQLDAEELQMAAQAEADEFEDMDDDEEEVDAPGAEGLILPTAEERAEEKRSGGPEVHVVQKRMRECVKILKRWKVSGAKTGRFVILFVFEAFGNDRYNLDRSRADFVEQLVSDIASYYGYNDFLTEKLFQLFPIAEVRPPDFSTREMYADNQIRLSSSSMQTRFLVPLLSERTLYAPDVGILPKC
jgi:ribosomal RNA methyltransferase Nop2